MHPSMYPSIHPSSTIFQELGDGDGHDELKSSQSRKQAVMIKQAVMEPGRPWQGALNSHLAG